MEEETHKEETNDEQRNELNNILSQIRNTSIGDKPGDSLPIHPPRHTPLALSLKSDTFNRGTYRLKKLAVFHCRVKVSSSSNKVS
jgi:hypothetical protein